MNHYNWQSGKSASTISSKAWEIVWIFMRNTNKMIKTKWFSMINSGFFLAIPGDLTYIAEFFHIQQYEAKKLLRMKRFTLQQSRENIKIHYKNGRDSSCNTEFGGKIAPAGTSFCCSRKCGRKTRFDYFSSFFHKQLHFYLIIKESSPIGKPYIYFCSLIVKYRVRFCLIHILFNHGFLRPRK